MRTRRSKRIWFVILGVFVAVFLFTFLTQKFKTDDKDASAASLAKFDPGFIISDYQMGNYNSMTEKEIQNFLTSKNNCSNTNYNYYLSLSTNNNYKWHFENGHFICLSEERFGDGETIGKGDTAAHIIWQAAQDYKINPKVLIVLLQKETGLITDPIPNNGDYRKATGYGCPDTAPCSSQYYGFKNQVRKAAALFHAVLTGGWTNYPLGKNYIQYNPNAGCGGSVVNIRNLATSALYRYTPYQPNAGALAAGYGTAYCGAYGNRNFYLYFQDWFGGVTSEERWIKMETSRYMVTNKKTYYYNPDSYRNYSDFQNADLVDYYSEKTILNNGDICLRSLRDAKDNKNRCVLYDDLQEVKWQFSEMDSPRYLEIKDNSSLIDINTRSIVGKPKKYEYYDQKVFLPDGDMCLRIQGTKTNTCVLYSTLEEVKYQVYDMESPRYLEVKYKNTKIIDASNNKEVNDVSISGKMFFDKKIVLPDNSICLLVKSKIEYSCIRFTDLNETWMKMTYPREMRMTKNSYKINAKTTKKDYGISLTLGLKRRFVRKYYLRNGAWCLQTEYDSDRNTDNCVIDYELGEL